MTAKSLSPFCRKRCKQKPLTKSPPGCLSVTVTQWMFLMRASLRFVVVCLLISAVISLCVWRYFTHAEIPPEPPLSAQVRSESLRVGALERSFLSYIPHGLPAGAPLVIVLHSGKQTAQDARVWTGYEFDRLADEHRFATAYPNGYQLHWNDCRKEPASAARSLDVDDKAFLEALVERLHSESSIDPRRVFVVGYGNGAQMAYRLAVEAPERFAGIAAIAANLPARENMRCAESGGPIPVLIMNGTSDPISPYEGGILALLRFANRGTVISAADSAEYFARLDGEAALPVVTRLPERDPGDSTTVERTDWAMAGKPEVELDTVRGGGHVVPQAVFRPPRIYGTASHNLDGPAEIWSFFARQAPRNVPKPVAASPAP